MQYPVLDRQTLLRNYCGNKDLIERIEFMPESDVSAAVMHQGLLLLMAFWSGPSILGFKTICRVFSETGLPDGFVFRVLDIDGASRDLLNNLPQYPIVIGGNAEGYWFLNDSIVSATNRQSATEEHIRQLLAG